MSNRQIPPAEWKPFFSDFTRRHEHELASVSLTSESIGAQHIATDLRFEGFVADDSGTRISIALGGSPETNLDHPIDGPTVVWVEQDDNGREVAVKIESAGGATTILEFGKVSRAGTQNGTGSNP